MDVIPYEIHLRQDRIWARNELDSFFMGGGPVNETLRNLCEKLDAAGIPYAVAGALALNEHGLLRATTDVDILVTKEGLAKFRDTYEGLGYVPAFAGAIKKFRDTETGVRIDFLTSGEYPGDGKPKPIVFPDPATVAVDINGMRVIGLERFIELKLASGLSSLHRGNDLADIQKLIRETHLPENLADRLDPSVREEYLRRWQFANTPDPNDEH